MGYFNSAHLINIIILPGVFSPKLPDICNIAAPFVCQDITSREGGVEILLASNYIDSGTVNSISVNGIICPTLMGDTLSKGISKVTCLDTSIREGEDVSVDFELTYQPSYRNLPHTIKGQGFTSVEITGEYTRALDSSLVIAYDFEDGGKDLSFKENDANLLDGVDCTVKGKTGKGCTFDGIDDKILVPESVSNQLNGKETLLMWVKPRGDYIFYQDNEWARRFWYNSDNFHLLITDTLYLVYDIPNTENPPDQWHHIGYTISEDRKTFAYYVNGKRLGPITIPNIIYGTSGPWNFGASIDSNEVEQFYEGEIDSIALYNRELSPEEILHIYDISK
ncbi:hypothetical protein CL617_03255 [archaeon]|nr:hypothetical protein [archaeon]